MDETGRPTGRHDAARRSYDTVAEQYADGFRGELAHKPLDRALLGSLIEAAGAGAPVADLGCGPGHVAGWPATVRPRWVSTCLMA